MWWFNKKKNKEQNEIPLPPHEHTWKDMPWYMKTWWSGQDRTAGYKIIEPYVCLTCGERKDIVLEETNWSNITSEARKEEYNEIKKKYKHYLKPQAVVEDMINNIILVKDSGRLEMVEKILGTPHRGVGTSSRYHVSKSSDDFKIKVDENE